MKTRVVHVINSFEFGGAEAMLCNLLKRSDHARFDARVISLIDDLTVAGPLTELGIPIEVIGMKPGRPSPLAAVRLARALRRARPQVVQTWMDHSNLIGGVASRLMTRAAVVWGIHHSNHVKGLTKRSTLWTVDACARLSRRVPSRIICCSESASELYGQRGFDLSRFTVIPNGFDTTAFRPDPAARAELRSQWGLGQEDLAVGLIARFDPNKDHANFLNAAAEVAGRVANVRFILCGDRVDGANAALVGQIDSLGLQGRCLLLGPRRDMPRFCNALDVCVSSSISEAFPLAVGEAMASGVPCAVTDVGDSRLMVGDTGRVVAARDSRALAGAIAELLLLSPDRRRALGEQARRRVLELFDLDAVTRRYEAIYLGLTAHRAQGDSSRPLPGAAATSA